MRKVLSLAYAGCGVLSGVFMVALALAILAQVGGALIGYVPRSADEFAGYFMGASAFLAMAYAFDRNEHIRVTLIVQRFQGRARHVADLVAVGVSSLLAIYFAWFSIRMTWLSWKYDDVSQGLIAVPLWVPQLGMAIGTTMLAVAVIDRTIQVARGGRLEDETAGESLGDR